MASRTQADYDALAPQLIARKRAEGPYAGKTIARHTCWHEGAFGAPCPQCNARTEAPAMRIIYTDETSEYLWFEHGVDLYRPEGMPEGVMESTPDSSPADGVDVLDHRGDRAAWEAFWREYNETGRVNGRAVSIMDVYLDEALHAIRVAATYDDAHPRGRLMQARASFAPKSGQETDEQ